MSSFPRTEITFLKAAKIQNGKKRASGVFLVTSTEIVLASQRTVM